MYYSGCRRSAHYLLQHTIKPNKNPRLMVRFWLYPVIMTIFFPRCVYPYQQAWLSMQHSRGAWFIGVSAQAPPTHEPSKSGKRILFPWEGTVTPAGCDLYEHLFVINPAVQHWKQSGNLPFGNNSIPSHRTRKERPGTPTAGEKHSFKCEILKPALVNTVKQVCFVFLKKIQ